MTLLLTKCNLYVSDADLRIFFTVSDLLLHFVALTKKEFSLGQTQVLRRCSFLKSKKSGIKPQKMILKSNELLVLVCHPKS